MPYPSQFTEETRKRIIMAVRAGNFMDVAAQYAGVTRKTLYEWIKLGRKQKRGLYRKFVEELDRALAEAEIRDMGRIDRAAERGVWQAAAWRLQQRHRDRYFYAKAREVYVQGDAAEPKAVRMPVRGPE